MYKKFPDTIVTIPFITAGLCLGHLFFLPWFDRALYDEYHLWPYFTFLFSIVVTASTISIIKLGNGKYIFEHFVYLFVASILFLTSGILFVLPTKRTAIGLFINVIASGMVCVAGLSYVNIRSEKHERPMRLAFCHMFKMLGFAGTYSIMLFLEGSMTLPDDAKREEFYMILGYSILGATVFFLFLLMINEVRQRQGLVYNYRDCLDHDNSIANNYCKLFSKNEVVIERNTATTTPNMWRSAENLLPEDRRNYTTLWTVYLLLTKFQGSVVFHYFLMTMTMNATFTGFDSLNVMYGLVVWIIIVSTLTGSFMLRIIRISTVYIWTSVVAVIAIGVSIVFYQETPPTGLAVCLLIYYTATTISLAIPDIAILEISKIRYNEGFLAIGHFAEIIPIAVLQHFQIDAHILTNVHWYIDEYYVLIVISSIVVLLVTSLIFLLHMPDTHGMSLLQIQNALLKHESYFAFKFDKSGSASKMPQNSAESSNYMVNEASNPNVIMFHRERSMTQSSTQSSKVPDILPAPPVNKVKSYDYGSEVPQHLSIIPRVNLAKIPNGYTDK